MYYMFEFFKLLRCLIWIGFFVFLILFFTHRITTVFYYLLIFIIFVELIKLLFKS